MKNEINNKILLNLNAQQKAAVVANENHLRIIAGAGSGKTGVLTKKIAYIIENGIAKAEKILAVTFTNKATNEMKERIFDLVGIKAKNTMISTFHSLCNFILRREINKLEDYSSNFDILDPSDQKNILENIYRKLNITSRDLSYSTVLDYISKWKNLEKKPEDINEQELEEEYQTIYSVYDLYCKKLEEIKALDFDDLMIFTVKIFREFPSVREKWSKKYSRILVDEFQDTSDLQFEIIKILTSNGAILTIVGDPDQTIYTWRGADPQLILNFDKYYPGAITVTLERNYRSTNIILSAANSLIEHNKQRLPKKLFTEIEGEQEIEFFHAFNIEAEARWVVTQINNLKKKKVQLKNIAIIYRSNFYSREFEEALIKENIPYQIVGGQKFFDKKVIKDVISYLKVINDGSTIGLMRIINVPSRKIGPVAVQKMIDFANQKQMNLFDALIDYFVNLKDYKNSKDFVELPLSHSIKKELVDFLNNINWARKMIKNKNSISLVLEKFLDKIKYLQSIKNPIEKNDAQVNIASFYESLKSKESKNAELNLTDYLNEVALMYEDSNENSLNSVVTLMTIHSAKGLEFQNVFLVGMVEGIFPSKKSVIQSEGLEEERRLAYVAITRAKERLFISDSGGNYFDLGTRSQTSRFVSEMGIKSEKLLNFTRLNPEGKLNYKHENANSPLIVGDIINHIVFGEGIVLEINDEVATIKFYKTNEVKNIMKNHKSIEKIN
ncbi:ATP-dependent helicase [Mesomycoplasma lagogenitalium]|uniref:DNA 3'-5' helicase n=1 Tax=Mesomycoplasma lagogenitalium TaxID=171286 RepID=A0ABY8LXB0_9BACT|nr:UvrD-helicase domain-containing protein [Mesomycoplasma lagogenitalium]WGI36963.1 UvrD-helicase domain-containing protein [Mesomycoplasma lagogenitalium]